MACKICVLQSIGQIGNRLEQFAHLIAFSKETGTEIINPSFSRYAKYFSGTHDDYLGRFPAVHSGKTKTTTQIAIYYFLRALLASGTVKFFPKSICVNVHWSSSSYDLGNPQFRRFTTEYGWIFLSGHWKHRHWSAFEQSIPEIREHFSLVPELRGKVDTFVRSIRESCDILVGLHVRQGDNFTDPVRRDAFSSESYSRLAHKIVSLFPGRRVAFLLCSNQSQPAELYQGLVVKNGLGDFILDMYSLAECNFIVGAGQSSFSGWASLMGQKPRYALFDPEKPVSVEDFKVCRGLED